MSTRLLYIRVILYFEWRLSGKHKYVTGASWRIILCKTMHQVHHNPRSLDMKYSTLDNKPFKSFNKTCTHRKGGPHVNLQLTKIREPQLIIIRNKYTKEIVDLEVWSYDMLNVRLGHYNVFSVICVICWTDSFCFLSGPCSHIKVALCSWYATWWLWTSFTLI